jgi:hypothetical protein
MAVVGVLAAPAPEAAPQKRGKDERIQRNQPLHCSCSQCSAARGSSNASPAGVRTTATTRYEPTSSRGGATCGAFRVWMASMSRAWKTCSISTRRSWLQHQQKAPLARDVAQRDRQSLSRGAGCLDAAVCSALQRRSAGWPPRLCSFSLSWARSGQAQAVQTLYALLPSDFLGRTGQGSDRRYRQVGRCGCLKAASIRLPAR